MKQYTTEAIVLKRVAYQEADRIITVLTLDHGKRTLIARGTRKVKSKLAGGIELFTINEIVAIEGRGDIQTLRSARMKQHFSNIASDYQRLQVGYSFLQSADRLTETEAEDSYYQTLVSSLESLNDLEVPLPVVQFWFYLQFLILQGRQPSFVMDSDGEPLDSGRTYRFDVTEGVLQKQSQGSLSGDHIKFARLTLQMLPKQLTKIKQASQLADTWLKQLPVLTRH